MSWEVSLPSSLSWGFVCLDESHPAGGPGRGDPPASASSRDVWWGRRLRDQIWGVFGRGHGETSPAM